MVPEIEPVLVCEYASKAARQSISSKDRVLFNAGMLTPFEQFCGRR
jgi:hypothetical protein